VDRANGLAVARSAGGVRSLEQRVSPLQPMEPQGCLAAVFDALSDDPDFEYLIVDSTIVRARQHASGAQKGGLKIRLSAARAAG
jgi:hypothetical protein